MPRGAPRVLDLGTGDGRLLALLQSHRPALLGVGLDFSALMLDPARERFAGDERTELVEHDLAAQLPVLGRFDAVVSSIAIHHYWKWLEMALLIGVKPAVSPTAAP